MSSAAPTVHRDLFGGHPYHQEWLLLNPPSFITISAKRWSFWPHWVRMRVIDHFREFQMRPYKPNLGADEAEEVLYAGLYFEHAIKQVNPGLEHPFPHPDSNDPICAPGTVSHKLKYPTFPPLSRGNAYTFSQLEVAFRTWWTEVEYRFGRLSREEAFIHEFHKKHRFSSEAAWNWERKGVQDGVSMNLFVAHIHELLGLSFIRPARLLNTDNVLALFDAVKWFPHLWPEEQEQHPGQHPHNLRSLAVSHRRIGNRMAAIYGTTAGAFAAGRAFA